MWPPSSMRQVVADPAAAREVGERARRWVREHHGPAARAGFLRSRLEEIELARDRAVPPTSSPRTRPGERYVQRILRSERLMRYPRAAARRILSLSGNP